MAKIEAIPFFLAGAKDKSAAPPSIERAREILGKKKVFPSHEVAKAWDREKIHEKLIPFRVETLEWCAAENAAGKAYWLLLYDLGQALTEMFLLRGENEKKQPCFHPTYNYYPRLFHELNHMHPYYAEASPWIGKGRKADYRLIDFSPKFKKMTFADQERRISSLGGKFFRTSAPVFAEAIMSIFMISKKRIAEDWYHWAPEKHMHGGYHVAIGRFIPYGLATMPGYEGAGHGVVISRQNDLQ